MRNIFLPGKIVSPKRSAKHTNKEDIIIYYNAAFTALRMLVGALSAVYLLHHGVSIVAIGLMKSMQSAIYFAFDIPSSYLADKYSRKAAVIIATVLGGLWLLITGLANSVPLFFAAEALNALSLTILGGVIQAYIIDNADNDENMHRIMGRVNKLGFFFMAAASLFGSYLAFLYDRLPWIIGGIGCLMLAAVFGRALPKPVIRLTQTEAAANLAQAEKAAETGFFRALAGLFRQKAILQQALGLMSLAILFQFLLQYWQLLITFPRGGALGYGLLFFFILMAQSAAGSITAKLSNSGAVFAAILTLAWGCIIGLSLGLYLDSNALKIAAIVPLFGLMQILLSFSGARFHTMILSPMRSTSESVVSTSAKFLVMIFMPLVAYAAAHGSWLYFTAFLALLLTICTALNLKGKTWAAKPNKYQGQH